MDNLEQKYELLKAQAVIDAAEIERLKIDLDSMRFKFKKSISLEHDLFDKGWNQCSERVVSEINEILGDKK